MAESNDLPDVCIIGAGLAGGIAAYELASRGVRVTVLEAGPRYDLGERFERMNLRLYSGEKPWDSDMPERDVFANAGAIDYPLNDLRVKAVGGSTLHWGALALRFTEADFKLRTLHGVGEDWPISYAELEPYYGLAERALGVAGIADNPFASARSSDFPLPAFPHSYADRFYRRACDKLGITMHSAPWARNSAPYQNAPMCRAFATCGTQRICPIAAQYTAERHIDLLEKTGKGTLIVGANVTAINAGANGRIRSVTYVDRDGREHEQKARAFVVAAHAVESARLLLLSRSPHFPDGLANRSGLVGRNFMDHIGVYVEGRIAERTFPYRIGFHTAESHQFCAPANRDEISGIKLEFINNAGPKPHELANRSAKWGRALAEEVREGFGRHVGVFAQLEQLPHIENSITLDPELKDCFGNPAPRIAYSVGSYGRASLERATALLAEIMDALNASDLEYREGYNFGAHHMGTCRMGDDPERAVVDRNLRAHGHDNLYVVGSSVFPTGSPYQPSLTIAALAIRAANHIAGGGAGRKESG